MRLFPPGSKTFKDISTLHNVNGPGMDPILRNEKTRQLYHTSGNILSTLDTNFYFFSQHLSHRQQHDHHNALDYDFLTIYSPHYKLIFEFINPSQLLNSKQQTCQILFKRYRNQLYRQKIKIRKFFPTNNKLIENTDKVTHPMTKRHLEIIRDL